MSKQAMQPTASVVCLALFSGLGGFLCAAERIVPVPTAQEAHDLAAIGTWDGRTPPTALAGPYEDRLQQELGFGQRSYYLAPWRSYMDTWPASRYHRGLGFCWNGRNEEAPAAFKIFSEAGFNEARIEVGWGMVEFDHPDRLPKNVADQLTKILREAHAAGLRVLIFLNSNQGNPCPLREVRVKLREDASKGARQLALSEVKGIRIGYTGINTPAAYKNPAYFITKFDPDSHVCELSAPLPVELKKGQDIGMETLRFQPMSGPVFADGTANPACQETLDGWLGYVKAICDVARDALAGANPADAGFDLEVWNEYSFGSDFLHIENYYDPKPKFKEKARYSSHGRTQEGPEVVLPMTVDYVNDPANKLPGVRVISGFANQRPFDSGTSMWPGQAGFSRHYYTGVSDIPVIAESEAAKRDAPLNALGKPDPGPPGSYFVPSHFDRMPEEKDFAYQTEFMTRDLQPFPGPWSAHHRYSHPGTGRAAEDWMTEYNFGRWPWTRQLMEQFHIAERDPKLNAMMEEVSGKAMLRASVFHSHKGVDTITYFCARDKVGDLGLVPVEFYEQLKEDKYQLTDAARRLAGRQMEVIGRVNKFMSQGKPIDAPRKLSLTRLVEHEPRLVFRGDGTPAHPDRFNRDDFACLPFQLDDHRYAIAYYVVTRDLMHVWDGSRDTLDPARYDMPDQQFDLTLANIRGVSAKVSGWDPRTDASFPVGVLDSSGTSLSVQLPTRDWPRFLIVEESAAGPSIQTPSLRPKGGGALLTFRTNPATEAKISWGPPPNRVRYGSVSAPASVEHEVTLPHLAPNAGVRIEVEKDGLVCTWPEWGHDVQGVLEWQPINSSDAQVTSATLMHWPGLPAAARPISYRAAALPTGLAWHEAGGHQSLQLGGEGNQVQVTLGVQSVAATSPTEALPAVSSIDRVNVETTTWSGIAAWRADLTLDAAAHPGMTGLRQIHLLSPLKNGVLSLSFVGTPQALQQEAARIDAIIESVQFDAPPAPIP